MPQHDGAARRWLLRRWECVPSLIPPNRSPQDVSLVALLVERGGASVDKVHSP